MKHNVFKIKKNLKSKNQHGQQRKKMLMDSQSQSSPSKHQNPHGMKLLEKMKQTKKQKNSLQLDESIQINPDLHEKDKSFLVPLPSKESMHELSIEYMQKWFTKVFNLLLSVSYNYLTKNACTAKQIKHYMSENSIRHLLKLTQETPLSETQIQKIRYHIQNKVIPYQLTKYSNSNNHKQKNVLYDAFEKQVTAQKYENDVFYNNKKLKVLYRANGNYNDLIMNVINHIASKMEAKAFIESKSDKKQESIQNIIKSFQKYMMKIVSSNQKGSKSQKSNIKMEFINAIPHDFQRFSEQSIINRYFESDSPFVLNILINWSQQLSKKFENPHYYRQNQNKFLNHRGKIVYLKDNCATALSQYLQEEAQLIEEYLETIKKKYYQYQSRILKNVFKDDHEVYIDEDEKYVGKYSFDIVTSLFQFYSLYINRLVHGLSKVSQRLEKQYSQTGGWKDGPLNLLSLQVIDLFKCKIKGDHSEILAIHEKISRNAQTSNELRVIKIQQRNQEGRSCLVEQIVFKKSFQCEIILQIQSQSSQLYKNNNIMYEVLNDIQKSTFGPFDYFSRQWIYSDQKWKQFSKLNKINPFQMLKYFQIHQLDLFYNIKQDDPSMLDYNLPFECCYCKTYHFTNNYIISNQKHRDNDLFKCFRCRLQQMNDKQIRSILLPQEDNVNLAKYQLIKMNRMPCKGIAIPIHGKEARYQHFATFKMNNQSYFLGKEKGSIYQVVKNSPKQIQHYLKNHYVFSLPDSFNFDEDQLITQNEVRANVYLPNYLLWVYQDNQDSIALIDQHLTQTQIKTLVQATGYERQRESIRKIQLMSNNLKNSSIIFDYYPKITHLDLENNIIVEITQKNNSNLKYLSLKNNDLFQIPSDIKKLINLEQLDVSNNHIKKLQNIAQLPNLKKLNVSFNAVKQLPKDIQKLNKLAQLNLQYNKQLQIPKRTLGKLTSLVTLRMNNCSLNHFGDYLFNLTKLELLDLSSNCITTIPERIESLNNLQYLYVNNNQISNLPLSLGKLQKMIALKLSHNKILHLNIKLSLLRQLQVLELNHNRIGRINESICDLVNLKKLLLHNNKIKQIPVNLSRCNNLEVITFEQNLLQSIPLGLKKCKSISYSLQKTLFNGSCNLLKIIPNVIVQLPYLKTLELCYNRIVQIPSFISKLTALQEINLNNNEFKELPQQMGQLSSLKEISMDNNKLQQLKDSVFQKLINLQMITAQNNQITTVSTFIFKNAVFVNLSGNKIVNLNIQSFNDAFQVRVLNLNNNSIDTIEKALQKFKNLKTLKLRRNKGTNLFKQTSSYMNKIKVDIEAPTV